MSKVGVYRNHTASLFSLMVDDHLNYLTKSVELEITLISVWAFLAFLLLLLSVRLSRFLRLFDLSLVRHVLFLWSSLLCSLHLWNLKLP